jgi:CheY-like chemotaxis protein
MEMQEFKAGQLHKVLKALQDNQFSGVAYINVAAGAQKQQRSRVLAFRNGMITYAAPQLLNAQELVLLLGKKFKVSGMESTINLARSKVKNQDSIREFLNIFIRFGIFQLQDIEEFMQLKVVSTLEQLLPYPGTLQPNTDTPFDLSYGADSHGFEWVQLQQTIAYRQQQWAELAPVISSMEAIPQRLEGAQDISDPTIAKHLERWVNGLHSVVDIGESLQQDSLRLARTYFQWAKKGWITFDDKDYSDSPSVTNHSNSDLPIILSVDDSPIVQTMIKRAICDRYRVLLASNAVDALNLMKGNKISLLLLDVTMPDIDGLELCRTIRNIAKFRDLPVIMLTAKEGMIDKLKGQIAGSTHYLTKPVDREKLLTVIEKYVLSAAVA